MGLQGQSLSKASMTNVKADNYTIPAVTIAFPISEKEMEAIFANKIRKSGAGKKTSKWSVSRKYRYYPAATVGEVSTDKLDYFYIVDGNKEKSQVTVFMSHGYDNFLNPADEKEPFDNLKVYLESLNEDVDQMNWEHRVEAQEEVVGKYQKAITDGETNLAKQQANLEKLQLQIEENKAAIENNKAELINQQELLESIKNEKK